MINKLIWFWKGIPENLNEFKEVVILWLISALFFGVMVALVITKIIVLLK